MKSLFILLFILAAGATAASAQQRTRDVLFPSFQKDITVVNPRLDKPDPRATATSTRNLIFTNYHPTSGNASKSSSAHLRPANAGGQKLPSDVSAADAKSALAPVKKEKPFLPTQQ